MKKLLGIINMFTILTAVMTSQVYSYFKTYQIRDFPGDPVVKNPPSNAGDVGLIPGQGTKVPHDSGQLSWHPQLLSSRASNERARVPQNYRAHALWSPCTTTTEPTCPGAHTPQLETENPHTTTREKPERHN